MIGIIRMSRLSPPADPAAVLVGASLDRLLHAVVEVVSAVTRC